MGDGKMPDHPNARVGALNALRGEAALRCAKQSLHHDDFTVREAALRALRRGPRGTRAAVDLAQLVRDPSWVVRARCLSTLRSRALSSAETKAVARALRDPHVLVRSRALCLVGELRPGTRKQLESDARAAVYGCAPEDFAALQAHISPVAGWTLRRVFVRAAKQLRSAVPLGKNLTHVLHGALPVPKVENGRNEDASQDGLGDEGKEHVGDLATDVH